jgi:3-hydroxyacyl-[acyl-carrier-protein] dehydratase
LTTLTELPSAEIGQILRNIPHRYPFLLIDRMEACEPGKWVRVVKNVTSSEQFFVGVPIDRRVMPQLLVLEALAQAAGVLCHFSGMMSEIGRSIIFFAGVEHCEFGKAPVPGDRLVLECVMKRSMRGVAKLSGSGHIDGTIAISAQLSAVVRNM